MADAPSPEAVIALQGVLDAATSGADPEIGAILSARDEVIARFQPIFSPSHIPALSAEEFRSFLRFSNNRHWSGIQRWGNRLTADMGGLRAALALLVDETARIEERLDLLRPQEGAPPVPGLDRAVITPILLVTRPDRYGVINRAAESGMRRLGLWPDLPSDLSYGTRYARVNAVLLALAGQLGVDLWTLDALWWRIDSGPSPQRNPAWTRDELILALDLYLRLPPSAASADHPQVVDLSEVLNRLPIHPARPDAERFRNPNGVYMKLGNFASIDPSYPGAGLRRGNRLEQEMWDEFAGDPERLGKTAAAIRTVAQIPSLTALAAEAVEDEAEAVEGRVLYRFHRTRERNPQLVRRKKEWALQKYGCLECEVCGFDFSKRYGALGDGFIECHHTKPVSELQPGEKTRLSDLALACANCHRMLHRSGAVGTVEALRQRVTTSAP